MPPSKARVFFSTHCTMSNDGEDRSYIVHAFKQDANTQPFLSETLNRLLARIPTAMKALHAVFTGARGGRR